MHRNILKFVRQQVREHSFGKLGFLTCVGRRAWGFAPDNIDYDYQGIYVSKQDNTYQVFLKNITLISFERIIDNILRGEIHFLIFINSPAIYISKELSGLKKWVNSNLSKQIYETCQIKQSFNLRRDYLEDFFFTGNGIAILEKKKVIANLSELNKNVLEIPAIDEIIEQEKARLPFKNKQICEEIQEKLKSRLKEANKKSRFPETVDPNKLSKLKIMKKIDIYFWYWPKGSRGVV